MRKAFLAVIPVILLTCTSCLSNNAASLGSAVVDSHAVTIDGVQIPSCSIDGESFIALDDLSGFGFTVEYNDEKITVTTADKPEKYESPEQLPTDSNGVVGDVSNASIKAYVNNVPIKSYEVNNKLYVSAKHLGELSDDYNLEWGWSDYNFKYTEDGNTLKLTAYRFPSEELMSRTTGSADNELELYTVGNRTAPYYGSPIEPKSGIYAGINADGTDDFDSLFGVYSSYFEFDQKLTQFSKPYKKTISDKDNINLIPWNISDASIVFENDDYIRKTLDNIVKTGKPSIIRFGAEMNCSTLGDSPSMYVKAFRHVADIVHEYDSLAVMWSPNDYGATNKPYELYYPGDEYVDWIGISCFLKHDFMNQSGFADSTMRIFGCGDYAWTSNSIKKIIDFMSRNGIEKPIAISEGAVESAVHYADIDLNGWAQPRLKAMYWYTAMKFPEVKLLTYFNMNVGNEEMEYGVTEEYADIIESAIDGAGYMTSASDTPSVTFTEAENDIYTDTLPLYAYAYFPHDTVQKIEYSIDGAIVSEASEIPYKVDISLSKLSHSVHTLSVDVVTNEQTYSYTYTLVYKNGWTLNPS